MGLPLADDVPEQTSVTDLRASLGEDIFAIFCEEVDEIRQRLQTLFPQWQQTPDDPHLRSELRRAFHTLKGSGRMAGAYALGELGWAHENLLNRLISGQLSASPPVLEQIGAAIDALAARQSFFQQATHSDAALDALLAKAHALAAESMATDHAATAPPALSNLLPAPDDAVMGSMDDASEAALIWRMFWEEAPEQLQALETHWQALHEHPEDSAAMRALERHFHTLKGGARMAQLHDMADIAHHAEAQLTDRSSIPASGLATLQQAIDRLHQLAEQYRQLPTPPSTTTGSTIPSLALPGLSRLPWTSTADAGNSLLEQLLSEQAEHLPPLSILAAQDREATQPKPIQTATQPNPPETIRLSTNFIDGLIDHTTQLNIQQAQLQEHFSLMGLDITELARTVARLRQQVRTLELETESQIHDGQRPAAQASGKPGFDPLEMDQYAELQRVSRALAESLSDLVNLEADLAAHVRKGEQLLHHHNQLTRQLQQELLDTRLVAVSTLVPRLRRLVRQVGNELGKEVELQVEGESCELDRNLLQRMAAPLEHLLRNAIAHGIETPAERVQQGKPRIGTITLSISRDDNALLIRCQDDGQGLNRTELQRKAIELGLLAPDQTVTAAELDRLILRPGFSTASTVSQIAGRGIGMNVVHSELKALGGSIQIHSTPGQGTAITLHLPFTLAVHPVLLAAVQEQTYALPLTGIQGVARLSGTAVQAALAANAPGVEFADTLYRLHDLATYLGTPRPAATWVATEHFPVIFVQHQGQAMAWVVDRLLGRREVVLQPLGTLFRHCRLYTAATIAPDGRVLLMPDWTELMRQAELGQPPATELTPTAPANPHLPTAPRIMVVDDSVTVRRVTEKFLSNQGYNVQTANDGMDALEQIAEFRPDAMLLDIEMPRMDGFELLGQLRRDPLWQALPIIMISSRTAHKHRDHAASLGATGFLGKPYQNEVLLDAIRTVLADRQHADDTTPEEAAAC